MKPEQYNEKPNLQWSYYTYWSGLPVDTFETYIHPDRGWALLPTNDDLTLLVLGWPYAEANAYKADVEANYLKTLELTPAVAERVRGAKREERFKRASVAALRRHQALAVAFQDGEDALDGIAMTQKGGLDDDRVEAFQIGFEHGKQESFLGCEEVVEAAAIGLSAFEDFGHAGGGVAFFPEEIAGGIEQAGAGVVNGLLLNGHSSHLSDRSSLPQPQDGNAGFRFVTPAAGPHTVWSV